MGRMSPTAAQGHPDYGDIAMSLLRHRPLARSSTDAAEEEVPVVDVSRHGASSKPRESEQLSLQYLLEKHEFDDASVILQDISFLVKDNVERDVWLVNSFNVLCDWWSSRHLASKSAREHPQGQLGWFNYLMNKLKPHQWAGKVLTAGLATVTQQQAALDAMSVRQMASGSGRNSGWDEEAARCRDRLWFASRLALHAHVLSILHLDQSVALICKHLARDPYADLLDAWFMARIADAFPMLCATLLSKLPMSQPLMTPFHVDRWVHKRRLTTVDLDQTKLDRHLVQAACISFPASMQVKAAATLFNRGIANGVAQFNKVGESSAFRAKPPLLAIISAGFAGFLPGFVVIGLLVVVVQFVTWLLNLVLCLGRRRSSSTEDLQDAKGSTDSGFVQATEESGFFQHQSGAVDYEIRLAVVRSVPIRGFVRMPASRLLGPLLEANVPVQMYGSPAMKTLLTFQWHAFAKYFIFFQIMDHILFMMVFILYAVMMAANWGSMGYGDATSDTIDTSPGTACLNSTEKGCLLILTIMIAFYTYQELRQMWAFSRSWWNSLWDIELVFGRLQFLSIALTATIMAIHWHYDCGASGWVLRMLSAAEVMLLFLRLMHFGRAFGRLGSFVRMFIQVLKDITVFLIVLVTVFCAFCVAFIVLQGPVTWANCNYVFLQMLTLVFGQVNYNYMYTTSIAVGPVLVGRAMILLKGLFQVIISIIMLNLLIAIINDSHDGIRQNEAVEVQRSRAMLILQAEALLPTSWQKHMINSLAHEFLCVIDIQEMLEDVAPAKGVSSMNVLPDAADALDAASDQWNGQMTELKKQFLRSHQALADKLRALEREVEAQEAMLAAVRQHLRPTSSPVTEA